MWGGGQQPVLLLLLFLLLLLLFCRQQRLLALFVLVGKNGATHLMSCRDSRICTRLQRDCSYPSLKSGEMEGSELVKGQFSLNVLYLGCH